MDGPKVQSVLCDVTRSHGRSARFAGCLATSRVERNQRIAGLDFVSLTASERRIVFPLTKTTQHGTLFITHHRFIAVSRVSRVGFEIHADDGSVETELISCCFRRRSCAWLCRSRIFGRSGVEQAGKAQRMRLRRGLDPKSRNHRCPSESWDEHLPCCRQRVCTAPPSSFAPKILHRHSGLSLWT
jgi:hypothetical protein